MDPCGGKMDSNSLSWWAAENVELHFISKACGLFTTFGTRKNSASSHGKRSTRYSKWRRVTVISGRSYKWPSHANRLACSRTRCHQFEEESGCHLWRGRWRALRCGLQGNNIATWPDWRRRIHVNPTISSYMLHSRKTDRRATPWYRANGVHANWWEFTRHSIASP